MIQIKKLKRPNKKSGDALKPGESSEQKAFGVVITNVGKCTVYVDRVTKKQKK
jgi:hypothetical protein